MGEWWTDPNPAPEPQEPIYVPIIKTLPPEYIYETIVSDHDIYQTIYEQLPPEVVIQYVMQYIYQKVYEEITREPTDEEIQEYIKKLPPEYIFQYLTDTQIEYIESLLPPNIVIREVPQYIHDIEYVDVYQYIYETEYQTIYEEITRNPTPEEIQEFIKQLPPETIFQYLTEEQIQYIKDQIPPEVVIQQVPPEVIIEYLPSQVLLQSISIVDIEYIIFSGDATSYNDKSPTPGGTSLTTQEKATNDDIVNVMAKMLESKDYLLILHGHANPVDNTPAEAEVLKQMSLARADSVRSKLESVYTGGEPLNNRITTKGYGGERNVSVSGSSVYASLNRRVEAILFTIQTNQVSGGN
jgi:outer membrane protein OmpA-like peptidoglycan-associated protein